MRKVLAFITFMVATAALSQTTVRSRLELVHPDLGFPGGAPLHTNVANIYEKIGDNITTRYFKTTGLANFATVDFAHNLNTDISGLEILKYRLIDDATNDLEILTDATTPTENQVAVAATSGDLKNSITVTNTSGASVDIAIVVLTGNYPNIIGDLGDVDTTTAAPEEGQTIVWDGSQFIPGASGDSSFKLQEVTTAGVLTIKGGFIIDQNGVEYGTYDGSGTTPQDFGIDITIDLDDVVTAVDNTDYYVYIDKLTPPEVEISQISRFVRAVSDSNHFHVSTVKPDAIGSRYIPLGFVERSVGTWGTTFLTNIATRRSDAPSAIINPIVYQQEMSVGTVGAKSNDYGALTDADFPTPANAAYYHLDGDADADGQAGGNLTETNAPAYIGKGFFGRESIAKFNGVDDIVQSSDAHFAANQDFTSGGWFVFYPDDNTQNVFGKYASTGNQRAWKVFLSSTNENELAVLSSSDGVATSGVESLGITPESGKPYHVVYVNDNDVGQFVYINGQLTFSTTAEVGLFNSSEEFIIGTDGEESAFANVEVQDFFFYQGVLTDDQINAIYSKRFRATMLRAGHELTNESFTLDSLTDKVSYYNLGDLNDDSGNGHTLTANGGVSAGSAIGIDGASSSATEFDGTDDYLSNADTFFDFTNEFTLSAWVKQDWESGSNGTFMSKYGSSGSRSFTFLYLSGGECRFIVNNDGTANVNFSVPSCGSLTTNAWHHVAAVFDRGAVKVYVDGLLELSDKATFTTVFDTSSDFVIGAEASGNNPLEGSMDEIVAANYAMTPYEIQKLYAGSLAHNKQLQEVNQEWQFALQSEDTQSFNGSVFDPVIDMQAANLYFSPDYEVGTLVTAQLKDKGFTAQGVATQMFDRVYSAAIPASVAHGLSDPYGAPCKIGFEGQATAGDWSWEACAGHCEVDSTDLVCSLASAPTPTNRVRVVLGAAESSVPEHGDGVTGLLPSGASTIYGEKTFTDDPIFDSGSVVVTTGAQNYAGEKTHTDLLTVSSAEGSALLELKENSGDELVLDAGSFGAGVANGGFLRLYSDGETPTIVLDGRDDNGTRHVYFNNGGNVGIGTASPGARLHVDGTFKVGGSRELIASGNSTTDASNQTVLSIVNNTSKNVNLGGLLHVVFSSASTTDNEHYLVSLSGRTNSSGNWTHEGKFEIANNGSGSVTVGSSGNEYTVSIDPTDTDLNRVTVQFFGSLVNGDGTIEILP